jgi:Fic family protein
MEPFDPPLLPPAIDYASLIKEIAVAHRELGKVNGSLLHPVINPDLLITPLLTKEAVLSSAIEGTVATVEDVFRYEAEDAELQDREIRTDAQEIVNYRSALEEAMDQLEKRAIGENLLKRSHFLLLDSVRGARKNRGNFRRELVYIGSPRSKIEDASFIPARPERIPELLKNWEIYINSADEKDPLVQIAVAHYQFEAIHPFLDGNGRIGRLVIPVFLCDRDLLRFPVLYISEYFEQNRDEYINCLRAVDERQDWHRWVSFFLTALRTQALRTQLSILEIVNLYNSLREKIATMGSAYAFPMLDLIFVRPVVNYTILKSHLGSSSQTVYNLLEKFENEEILIPFGEKKRNRQYIFPELLNLLR